MNPLISIIVPVYNGDKYLSRCVDSILNQTFQNWELLLVDDGSTDKSGEICDEYATKDKRVKAFHKENGGVSSARNIGLDNVKGDWITFVDADDELIQNSFSNDYIFSKEDLIAGAYYTNVEKKLQSIQFNYVLCTNSNELLAFLSKNIDLPIFRVVWGKLFKTELCKGLYFDTKMKIGEDTLFMMEYLSKIKSFKIVETFVYIYNMPENFILKYSHDIKSSIYCLDRIFSSYAKLAIRSKTFERTMFFDYKLFCQMDIYKNVKLWYDNVKVKKIYNQIKDVFPLHYRILYNLMSYPYISKLVNMFRNR